jgi:adenosylmethionine-8-amino-7-oxononanoate aminotransferase
VTKSGGYFSIALACGQYRLIEGACGDVRGKGLLCAIDLVRNKETKEAWGTEHPFIKGLALRSQEQGLITRVWDVLHLAPPLVITEPRGRARDRDRGQLPHRDGA